MPVENQVVMVLDLPVYFYVETQGRVVEDAALVSEVTDDIFLSQTQEEVYRGQVEE